MKKILLSLAVLPFLGGAALAGQPLNDQQMDNVTAGFTSISIADAEGLVGESGIVLTTTGSLSQVNAVAVATYLETASVLFKSVAGAQSSTVTSTYSPAPIPNVGP